MEKKLSLLSLALLLAACGGGGGDNNHVADQQTPRLDGTAREALFIAHMDEGDYFNYPHFDLMMHGGRYAYFSNAEQRIVVDPNVLPRGLSGEQTLRILARKADGTTVSKDVRARSYRGFYSGITASEKQNIIQDPSDPGAFDLGLWYFSATPEAGLPNSGRTTYHGNAFGPQADNTAGFSYHVDFGTKTGSGAIAANAYHSAIVLEKETLRQSNFAGNPHYEFDGTATSTSHGRGGYSVILSGPNAEEVIGSVTLGLNDDDFAFYGTRGEIAP